MTSLKNRLMSPTEYLLSLCNLAQDCQQSFGTAIRIGASNSTFNVEATKVIHSLLTFSPAPDAVAVEFLNELEKVRGIAFLVAPVRCHASQLDCSTWAETVINFLSNEFTEEQRLREIEPVTNLASKMLTHLLIATSNPGGKKTPQDTANTTPDIREIHKLLEEAITKRSQSALKQLLLYRDGFFCPFTGAPFKPLRRHVVPRATHILPFSFREKHLTLSALEIFTGRTLADEVIKMINHPSNAFHAQRDAHESYDKLAWGIEAVRVNDQWKYYFREIRHEEISFTITLSDEQEIIFGRGDPIGQVIDKPNPEYCNMKLAIARVMNACGVADIITEMGWDNDDDEAIDNQPVYLGSPFVPDETLFRRLENRLLT